MADNKAKVFCDGDRVKVVNNGKLILDLPWQAAFAMGKALIHFSGEAEQWANAEKTVNDNAILHRAGMPVGLSDNPVIKKETHKAALYDRDLRRYMPNGIKSKEVFGTPNILQTRPKR